MSKSQLHSRGRTQRSFVFYQTPFRVFGVFVDILEKQSKLPPTRFGRLNSHELHACTLVDLAFVKSKTNLTSLLSSQ
jgi:hypothetical protein